MTRQIKSLLSTVLHIFFILQFMEHFSDFGASFYKRTQHRNNTQKCKTPQMNVSMRHRDSGDIHRSLCAGNLGNQCQRNEQISWQPSDFSTWTDAEPLVWTCLPVRRNGLNDPDIIYFPSRGVSYNVTVEDIAFRGCTCSVVCGNEGVRQTVQAGNDYTNACLTSCKGDTPHRNIFQCSGACDTESTRSEDVDIFNENCGVFSNESEDYVNDYHSTECELHNYVNEECDVINHQDNFPISLGDLDHILRMLSSNLIERDAFLKHMTDEEVALIMYNHDDGDEDAEIVSLNVIHEAICDARLPNPVACYLERTANEYFLPIACDALKDKR